MLQAKEKLLVLFLIQNKDKFVTSRDIAQHLDCSDRTVRTYYKNINELLNDYSGLNITAKQGHGYCLTISDVKSYRQFLKDFHIETNNPQHFNQANHQDRLAYILNKLLFEQEDVYFDDLAQEFFVSRSTLSNDFKKIREQMQAYHLKVESRANKGVYVSGTERNKRRFIMEYFVQNKFVNTFHQYIDKDFFKEAITFEQLMIIVLDECRESGLKLSDFVLQNLVIHIALALRRVSEGFSINKLEMSTSLIEGQPKEVATKIFKRVEQATNIDIPIEEIDYIALHLIAKGHVNQTSAKVIVNVKEQLRLELNQVFQLYQTKIPYAFAQDFQLIEGLVTHLETMLIRLENNVLLENPLLQDIKTDYPSKLDLTRAILAAMPSFDGWEISEDELAYVTLHLLAAWERQKEKSKANVLVICATGFGSAQMLKNRIENELGHLLTIKDVIGYYEINKETLANVDYIISSIDLSNLIFNIPVFNVSVFLKDDEVKLIKQAIKKEKSSSDLQIMNRQENTKVKEIFDEYCQESRFFTFDSIEKTQLLNQLVESMARDEDEDYLSSMLTMMEQREAMSTVVFSQEVAVPHPVQPIGHHRRLAIGVIREGVYWDEEFPKIKFVFLPSLSMHGNEGLSQLSKLIVDLVDLPEIQNKLLDCTNFEDFKHIFLSIRSGER